MLASKVLKGRVLRPLLNTSTQLSHFYCVRNSLKSRQLYYCWQWETSGPWSVKQKTEQMIWWHLPNGEFSTGSTTEMKLYITRLVQKENCATWAADVCRRVQVALWCSLSALVHLRGMNLKGLTLQQYAGAPSY